MPVHASLRPGIELEDVVRRSGGRRAGGLPPALMTLVRELLAEVEADGLAAPALCYELIRVATVTGGGMELEGGHFLRGRMLAVKCRPAEMIAAAMCTIGPELEARTALYQRDGDDLRAWVLDAIGNAALDALGREACLRTGQEAKAMGLTAGGALSPGLHGMEMEAQQTLFGLAGGERIGLSLTEGMMLVPAKSISMIVGIGENMTQWTKAESCEWCNLKLRCEFRPKDAQGAVANSGQPAASMARAEEAKR